jgi:hypothetical protein
MRKTGILSLILFRERSTVVKLFSADDETRGRIVNISSVSGKPADGAGIILLRKQAN